MDEDDSGDKDHDVSWTSVKRSRRDSPILTQNRFGPLATISDNSNNNCESDAQTTSAVITDNSELKPPAFYIDGVDNIEGMIRKFTELTGENSFSCIPQADKTIKVSAKTIRVYKALTRFLTDMDLAYHTYQVKSEKSFDVVVNKLHRSYKIEDLTFFLEAKGHKVRSATVMQTKVYDRQTEKTIRVYMDKFLVHLEPAPNNKDIYSITNIDHCIVSIEAPHKKPNNGVAPQCTNCQRRGHTKNYCFRPPNCVKCAGRHHTSKCTIKKDQPPKCVNCDGAHTANYMGCPDFQKRRRPQVNQQERQSFNFSRSGPEPQFRSQSQGDTNPMTYASVVSQDQSFKRIEDLIMKQIETMNTLMNMMSMLINQICHK